MGKIKTFYNCTNCDYQTPKWLGCCPECKEWNTLELAKENNSIIQSQVKSGPALSMTSLVDVKLVPKGRMLCNIKEWDRVTGGGLMPGSFVVITGDPGIGKSTLLLHVANNLSKNYKVLYFSSEESLEQVKLRAERLDCLSPDLLFSDQANLDDIINTSLAHKPDLVVIDSIQNCYTSDLQALPGSVGQLKEAAFKLMRLAKENNIAVIVTGHITKEGYIAGPKTLEHIVDAVFYLQGDDRWQTRMLRSVKNRFGTVSEVGFFQMGANGMEEVPNINQQLIEDTSYTPGSVLISYVEGTRPLLIELQALTISSKFSMPQRIISGIDQTQVILIAAILEKYLQVKLSSNDIFFKVAGGFKIKGAGADLGIALALLSSYFQKPLAKKSLVMGEMGLTGQIKPINQMSLHLNEATKFGIENLIVARNQKIEENKCKLSKFQNVYELLSLFGDI